MSIKIFGKGLGESVHPFNSDESVTQTVASSPLEGLKTERAIRDFLAPKSLPLSNNLRNAVQIPTGDIRKNFSIAPLDRPVQNLKLGPQLFSGRSAEAPFETFFHDLDLGAYPFYNFWTADELTNDRDDLGTRKLEDVPRFVKLVWKTAPDLPDPVERLMPKPVDVRPMKPVIFSKENAKPHVFNKKGVSFSPEHLQPAGFSQIKSILANGFLAPGVLETMVEMPIGNLSGQDHRNSTQIDPVENFDEDAFLTDPSMSGVSVHELKAQINQVANGIAGMSTPTPSTVSADLEKAKGELVDGKFVVTKALRSGGFMRVSSVHPSSPSISIKMRTAQSAANTGVDPVIEKADRISQPENTNQFQDSAQVKVKFINPSVTGLLDQKKINLMSAPHQLETLSALAPAMAQLEFLSRTDIYDKPRFYEPLSVPSPKMKPLEYIGYVIEKYQRQKSGVFKKVDEIDIPSRAVDTYIDTKVLYGEIYRYRLKCIIRWNRPHDQFVSGVDPTIESRFATHTAQLADHKTSFFSSEWNHSWAYATCVDDQPPTPPDELSVFPQSSRKRIMVTFKAPGDPQKDLFRLRLFRKQKDQDGKDTTGWVQVKDEKMNHVEFRPGNCVFFDYDIDYFEKAHQRYVYAAQTISRHGESSALSEQISARIRQDYSVKGEYGLEFVSSPGVKLDYYGSFSTIPNMISKTDIILQPAPTKIGKSPGTVEAVFSGRENTGNAMIQDAEYVCRIESLDTGEVRDIPFSSVVKNVNVRLDIAKFDFYGTKQTVDGKNSNELTKDALINQFNPPKQSAKGPALQSLFGNELNLANLTKL